MPNSRPPLAVAKTGGTDRAEEGYDASLNSFFNALVKENSLARYRDDGETPCFVIEVADGELLVPCSHRSTSGRHRLQAPCLLEGTEQRTLSVPEAVDMALATLDASREDRGRVLKRLLRSRRNIEQAIEERSDELDHLFTSSLSFGEAEQALLLGHSLHPCPKDRGSIGPKDARAWTPDHAACFPLVWVAIDAQRLETFTAGGDAIALLASFFEDDVEQREGNSCLTGDEVAVPSHPYQVHAWRAHPRLASAFEAGDLRTLTTGDRAWRPTTSVRTLYQPEAEWMAKVSLSITLTNSLRHLTVEELARGPLFAQLLRAPQTRDFCSRFSQLHILEEPLSLVLCDGGGRPVEASGLALRANPFRASRAEDTEVLATLLQEDPRDGEPRLVKRLRAAGCNDEPSTKRWFEEFLSVAVRPFLVAHGDHGLIFSAHQQNVVLGLDGIWPRKVYFRDCQGVGFSPLGQRHFGETLSSWPQDVALRFDQETSAILLGYYLIVNSVFNVISTLAMAGWVDEQALLEQLASMLQGLRGEGIVDDELVRRLLEEPQLHLKANLGYALGGINETTQSCDILDMYRTIPNPIRGIHP